MTMTRLILVPVLVSVLLLLAFALVAVTTAAQSWEVRYTVRGASVWSVRLADLDRKLTVTVIPEANINGVATVAADNRAAAWSFGGYLRLWSDTTANALEIGRGDRPAWSPDGRTLIYHEEGVLWEVTREEDGTFSQPRRFVSFRLNDFGLWAEIAPVWRPDGEVLALHVTYRNASRIIRGAEIFTISARGMRQRSLSDTDSTMPQRPAWSPDGEMLAVSMLENGERGIYTISSNGLDLKRRLDFEFPVQSLVWSPDSTYLAFTAENTGERGIYVLHVESGEVRGPLETPFGLSVRGALAWSPDGTRLAFVATDQRGLYTMPVDGGLPRRIDNPDGYTEILQP